MARPIWDGQINFGLINIPVQLFAAEKKTDVPLHQLDDRDHSRIHYERVNNKTGKTVPWEHIVKGYEFKKNQYVVVDKEDFENADTHLSKSIDLVGFVDKDAIDTLFFEKPYYLVPDKKSTKGYSLLRDTLEEEGKIGVARVVVKTREYIGALMPWNDILIVMLMRFQEEIVDIENIDFPSMKTRVSPQELKMAKELIRAMSMEWKPEEFKNEYQHKLAEYIKKKANNKKPVKVDKESAAEPTSNVIDMVALLQKSMQKLGGRSTTTLNKASKKTRTRSSKSNTTRAKKSSSTKRTHKRAS